MIKYKHNFIKFKSPISKTWDKCTINLWVPLSSVQLIVFYNSFRGCRYETIEEMKEVVTTVIDTLTQEDFHGAFQKLLEWYKCIATGGDYFEGG